MEVRNKPARVQAIKEMAGEVCANPEAGAKLLPSLKGRLLYAAGHTFGRCTHMAVQAIGREGPRVSKEEFVNVLLRAVVTLEGAGPRRVGVGPKRPPVWLLTDGACEPGPGASRTALFFSIPKARDPFSSETLCRGCGSTLGKPRGKLRS